MPDNELLSTIFWQNNPNINKELRQRIALQMMASKKAYPKTLGEGLSAVGDSIGELGNIRGLTNAAAADEATGKAARDAMPGGGVVSDVVPPPAPGPTLASLTAPQPDAQPSISMPPPPPAAAPAAPPVDPRAAVTAQLMTPPAPGGPAANPTQPGAMPPVAAGSPLQALRQGIASSPDVMAQAQIPGITKAPPAAPLRRAPDDAQPAPIPGYVPPDRGQLAEPGVVPMSPREQWIINRIQNTPPAQRDAVTEALAPALQREQAIRAATQAQRTKAYELEQQHQNQVRLEHYKARQTQDERMIASQAGRQGLINGGVPAGSAAPGGGPDALLGTERSPQRTGTPVPPPLPPGITPAKWAELQAPELVKTITAVESATPDFHNVLRTIEQVRNHPGMEHGTGITAGYAPPGTAAYAFSGGPEGGLVGQLKGKNFLVAYQKLKGGGAVSEVEGTKAQQAQAAINPAAGKDAFLTALKELEDSVRRDMEVMQRKVNRPVTAWRRGDDNASHAPDIGQAAPGGKFVYIGGNPAEPTSWRAR